MRRVEPQMDAYVQLGPGGWLEVIAGCMFSGKTEELIRRLRRAVIARRDVLLVKPSIDDRYADNKVVTHADDSLPAVPINPNLPESILEIWEDSGRPPVVGIDEAQFFTSHLAHIAEKLVGHGVVVIAAGLDQDYQGRPFGSVPGLMAVAEKVTKLLAVCDVCGALASKSQRIHGGDQVVEVGGKKQYEARCRRHWEHR